MSASQKPLAKIVKLGSRGITHLLVPLMIVGAIGIGGTYMLVSSHADSVGCKRGKTMVNAAPGDFIKGKYKTAAKRSHGLICVSSVDGRQKATSTNTDTITSSFKCPRNSTFAYDKNNPDGTGYHNAWVFQTRVGGHGVHENDVKTYYCVKISNLFKNLDSRGKKFSSASQLTNPNNIGVLGSKHVYHFYPAFDLQPNGPNGNDGCNSEDYRHNGCNPNYFFFYEGARESYVLRK